VFISGVKLRLTASFPQIWLRSRDEYATMGLIVSNGSNEILWTVHRFTKRVAMAAGAACGQTGL